MGSTAVEQDIILPPWLNKDLLSEVLTKAKNLEICVIDFDAKAAVPKGDNYLSTLYRIVASYRETNGGNGIHKHYLILKTLPAGEVMQNFLAELKGYEKEEKMYDVIFPAMYQIMKEAYGKIHPLSARTLPCPIEKTLILEDLQHLGYKMANRRTGLDLDHCKISIKALARFHAGSVAVYKSDPTLMDDFSESFYSEDKEMKEKLKQHIDINLSTLAKIVETWSGYQHYAERIRKFIPTVIETMTQIVKPKEGSLNVLNHGDCWVNNMMYHYSPETGKVDDIRFVDFQIARFSSPALDLQYFMCNSPCDEVRFQHRESLLEDYHAELQETLSILDLDTNALTLQQLKDEFEEKEVFGFITACTILCAVLASSNDVPEFSELKEEDIKEGMESPMEKTYAGERFREVFQKMLLHYDKKGIF